MWKDGVSSSSPVDTKGVSDHLIQFWYYLPGVHAHKLQIQSLKITAHYLPITSNSLPLINQGSHDPLFSSGLIC